MGCYSRIHSITLVAVVYSTCRRPRMQRVKRLSIGPRSEAIFWLPGVSVNICLTTNGHEFTRIRRGIDAVRGTDKYFSLPRSTIRMMTTECTKTRRKPLREGNWRCLHGQSEHRDLATMTLHSSFSPRLRVSVVTIFS